MKTLGELIGGVGPARLAGDTPKGLRILGVETDSRKVKSGYLFIAIRGTRQDGGRFIGQAVRNGAIAVVAEQFDPAERIDSKIARVRVKDARAAASRLAALFYGEPSKSMRVIGITGTNGKTTTAYLIEHLLKHCQKKTGVIGTLDSHYGRCVIPQDRTTPGPVALQQILGRMKKAGCDAVAMEVSSHALDQRRADGVAFAGALFTNLTRDHLDYHRNYRNYFRAKTRLFERLLGRGGFAVINLDDRRGAALVRRTRARVFTTGVRAGADFMAKNVRAYARGMSFDLVRGRRRIATRLPLVGVHNVANTLGALAVCHGLGFDAFKLTGALEDFPGVPGRLERVDCGQDFSVLIDFAHTPDGLKNVLAALKPYCAGRLITLFGCGGDRDKAKRPQMACLAARYSDTVVVTSDNPRSEDPKAILRQIVAGFAGKFRNFRVIEDRARAIAWALAGARKGDTVLLAGKGHEQYQIIGSRSVPFCERQIVRGVLGAN